jgi:outer membrane receptor protein involved in Fe transport
MPAYGVFAQDTWRVTPRLNLTYGLRWDVAPPPTFTRGLGMFALTQVSNLSTVAIAPLGTSLYKTDWGSFGPRLGLAYSIFNRQNYTAVLRGGFGVFYDVQNALLGYMLGATPPASAQALYPNSVYPLTGSQLIAPLVSTTPPFTNFQGFDPNLKNQKTYQWNVALEQQL